MYRFINRAVAAITAVLFFSFQMTPVLAGDPPPPPPSGATKVENTGGGSSGSGTTDPVIKAYEVQGYRAVNVETNRPNQAAMEARKEEAKTRAEIARIEAAERRAEADRKADEKKELRRLRIQGNAETKVSCLQDHHRYYEMTDDIGPLGMCDTMDHGFRWKPKHTLLAIGLGLLTGAVTYTAYAGVKYHEWDNQ